MLGNEETDWNEKLLLACKNNDIALVEEAIKNGADVNAKDNAGFTPLMLAALEGNKEILEMLIKKGADLNAKNNFGDTALILAVSNPYPNDSIVEELIKAGADLNLQNNLKRSALITAVARGYKTGVEILINAKADLNLQDIYGRTALMVAIYNYYVDSPHYRLRLDENKKYTSNTIAMILIKAGADVNKRDEKGYTALMLATLSGDEELVKELIKAGADLNARTNYGEIVFTFAGLQKNTRIIEILKQLEKEQQKIIQEFTPYKREDQKQEKTKNF